MQLYHRRVLCLSIVIISVCEAKEADDSLTRAKAIFQVKCKTEATETVASTVDNISGFLRMDEYENGRPFVGGIVMHYGPFGGESNSHPHWMFFSARVRFY